ncbi:MAG: hypothetical protein EON58_03360 [Alphaproteobacteria bacterium]|nr:MAG: hypothetical protein EON58_03360 [Alphaproteobacteria bacterium]
MAGKSRNRKPLELAAFIGIESLCLARQPAGWNRRSKATRAVGVHHRRGGHTVGDTILRAEVGATAGMVAIEHLGADGMKIEQYVKIAPVAMHHGGQRWLFVCPVTGDHARKLYRYPGSRLFCSRKGLSEPVTYRCQRDSGAKRVMRQLWEVKGRVGAKGGLLGAFDQPDHMSNRDYIRHASRYLELASRLDLSTREFKFRRATSGG